MNNNQLNDLDLINSFSTFIGILNYDENLSQSYFNETLQEVITDIHKHLAKQDYKMDKILEELEDIKHENNKSTI